MPAALRLIHNPAPNSRSVTGSVGPERCRNGDLRAREYPTWPVGADVLCSRSPRNLKRRTPDQSEA